MIYLSLDLETTGLDADSCQILSLGAVIEDTSKKLSFKDIPKFHVILTHEFITGEPFALNMNRDIITGINSYLNTKNNEQREDLEYKYNAKFLHPRTIINELLKFLDENGIDGRNKITVAGKNFAAFDKKFLEKLTYFNTLPFGRRYIDPAMSFIDWEKDEVPPSLDECKIRAGVSGAVSHNALLDAWDVIQVLRTKY